MSFGAQALNLLRGVTANVASIASGVTALQGSPSQVALPGTAVVNTKVLAASTVTTVLAANTGRRGATMQNNSGQQVYVKLGSGASATSFTVLLALGQYYEVPFGYTGIITAFSTAAGASPGLNHTEITA